MPWRALLDRSSLGFGLCWGIQLVLLFSRSLFGADREGADLFNYAIGWGVVAAAISLFACARSLPLCSKGLNKFTVGVMRVSYSAFLIVGVLFVAASVALPGQTALHVAGGFCSGVGLGIGYLLWTQLMAYHDPDKIHVALFVSLLEGIAFFALLVWAQPLARIAGILVAAVVSCLLCRRYAGAIVRPEPLVPQGAMGAKLDSIATYAAVLTIGFVYGVGGLLSLNSTSAIQQNTVAWHLAVLVVSFILFVVVTQLLPRKASVALLFQLIFPLVVAANGVLPFAPWWYWDICTFILAGSFQLAEMLLFFSFATSAGREAHFPTMCFSLASMWIGINLGVFFASRLFKYGESLFFILASIAIATIVAFSAAMFILALVWRKQALRISSLNQERATLDSSDPATVEEMAVEKSPIQDLSLQILKGLSSRYGLTDREAEIIGYLAKGRSSTFISEKLYLSPNTVRGYIRTAYAKLGVHSKQEVIDLFDQDGTG